MGCGDHIPRPADDVISATKPFIQIIKKFGIGVLYKRLMFDLEFCENQCSNRHSLLGVVNENLSCFLYFLYNLN